VRRDDRRAASRQPEEGKQRRGLGGEEELRVSSELDMEVEMGSNKKNRPAGSYIRVVGSPGEKGTDQKRMGEPKRTKSVTGIGTSLESQHSGRWYASGSEEVALAPGTRGTTEPS